MLNESAATFLKKPRLWAGNENKTYLFMKRIILGGLCLALGLGASAQNQLAPKKTLDATRINEKISMDATLNEPAWQTAPAATDFVFLWPACGKPSSQRTVVKILYDDAALYIGAQCFDTQPDSIFHRLSKRDELETPTHFPLLSIPTATDKMHFNLA